MKIEIKILKEGGNKEIKIIKLPVQDHHPLFFGGLNNRSLHSLSQKRDHIVVVDMSELNGNLSAINPVKKTKKSVLKKKKKKKKNRKKNFFNSARVSLTVVLSFPVMLKRGGRPPMGIFLSNSSSVNPQYSGDKSKGTKRGCLDWGRGWVKEKTKKNMERGREKRKKQKDD